MAAAQYTAGRRWFLRTATGAAATVLAMGAQALFGASTASAGGGTVRDGCCLLFGHRTAWCPMLCKELGHNIRCWSCNQNRCKCCECTTSDTCFSGFTACSYKIGCCEL